MARTVSDSSSGAGDHAKALRSWLDKAVAWMRRRGVRWLAWLGGVVVAYALIGFFALPAVLRPLLERDLSAALGRHVTIGHVATNPFALSATLRDVAIADRSPGPPALTFDELYANADIASLFRWAPVITDLRLSQPALNIVRETDGTYNVSDLIERALAGPPGPPPRFAVTNIVVADGRVTFDDRPAGRRHEVTRLALGIPFLSSLPSQTDIRVEPAFSALVNGRAVAIRGETRPFKDTRETLLHLDFTDVALPTYVAYSPAPLPVAVESGVLESASRPAIRRARLGPTGADALGQAPAPRSRPRRAKGARLARVPSLSVGVDRLDVFGRKLEIGSVALDGVELDVRRDARGTLNLSRLAASPAKAGDDKPFAFRVKDIAIAPRNRASHRRRRRATVSRRRCATWRVHVANLASAAGEDAGVEASFVSDSGARVTHRGTFGLTPARAAGHLELGGVRLAPLFPYYGSALNLVVDDGTLEGSTDVRVEDAKEGPVFTLTHLEGKAVDVRMRLPDEREPLWRIPVLAVHGGSVDVAHRAVHFDVIESRGGIANLRRDKDGALNFARIVRGSSATDAAATQDAWQVDAATVALEDYAANFDDATVAPAGRLALSHASLKLARLSTAPRSTGSVTLRTTVNKGGRFDASGSFTTSPFAINVKLAAKDVAAVPFQPYLSQAARVVVTDGRASAQGDLTMVAAPQARAAFKGSVDLAGVAVLDEANGADLLRWKSLALSDVDAQSEPLAVSIGGIALDSFYARLLLNENGELNLQKLGRSEAAAAVPSAQPPPPRAAIVAGSAAQPPAASEATPATASDGATTWLKLGKATLTDGVLDFTDHFVRPNYSANVTGLSGTISSLAFDRPADLELHGSVQGSAPVEIAGRINPLARTLFLDIKASATGVDMPPLSPYSGKYVGYGIEKGKLSMKVAYRVDNRKLVAENTIILEQLTFGAKVDSPDAIKAPVQLAVALLKDRNGVIQFDLPVGGSIDDPQFSVGGLVFRALVNLVVKIVTAPFAILGHLGGHQEDVSYVEFAPGSSALDTPGQSKVQALGKALKERPGIKLDITGYVDPGQDGQALRQASLMRQVRAQKFDDLVKRGEPPASVDAVEVAADEYEPLLRRAYKAAKFAKPRNAVGLEKDLTREEMEPLLLANASVTDEDLRALAQHRAQSVQTLLLTREQVPAEQVFLVAPRLEGKDGAKDGGKDGRKPTRVDFALH
jgi:hypothetical protein